MRPHNLTRVAILALTIQLGWWNQVLTAHASPIPTLVDQDNEFSVHIVQAGETITTIAIGYKIGPDTLANFNGLSASASLNIGDLLIIPDSGAIGFSHEVVSVGAADTVSQLAMNNKTDPERLARSNRVVNPESIVFGGIMVVPESGLPEQAQMIHTDANALWRVALASNSSPYSVAELNSLKNPYIIMIGHPLYVFFHDTAEALPPVGLSLSISLNPSQIEAGRTAHLHVETDRPGVLTGNLLDNDISFSQNENTWDAFVGIDRWERPQVSHLLLTFVDEFGNSTFIKRNIRIFAGGYQREDLNLSDDLTALLGDPNEVAAELAYLSAKMTGSSQTPRWSGPFHLPTQGVLTSAYGSVRSYGDGVSANTFHTGADLAAPVGTPIYAPAGGVVVDTGQLNIRGLITIVDHGAGVYTGYWHQSSILVKTGDIVKAGQQIGTVGATGLSTAAHLHWEMWVSGVQVDPMQWVRVSLRQ